MSIEIAAFALSMWVLPVAVACHGCSNKEAQQQRKMLLSAASRIKLEEDESYYKRSNSYHDDESIEVTIDQSIASSSYNRSLLCY